MSGQKVIFLYIFFLDEHIEVVSRTPFIDPFMEPPLDLSGSSSSFLFVSQTDILSNYIYINFRNAMKSIFGNKLKLIFRSFSFNPR